MKKRKMIDVVLFAVLSVLLVATIFPILYTILSSFKTNMEIMTDPAGLFPKKFTLDNYRMALETDNFGVTRMLINSIVYTLFNVAVSVITASMGGYVFSRGRFPFKKFIFGCFTAIMFIKLGGISIYATFDVLNLLHIKRSLWSLMLIQLFGVPIINIYLVKSYIDGLPKELDEAGKIDGCGFVKILFSIILPLLKPIIATVGILAFQASWNDYLMPTIFTLNHENQQTLIVGIMALKNSDGAAVSWNLMLAGATIALLPVLIAYAFANKYFVNGLAAGAVKG